MRQPGFHGNRRGTVASIRPKLWNPFWEQVNDGREDQTKTGEGVCVEGGWGGGLEGDVTLVLINVRNKRRRNLKWLSIKWKDCSILHSTVGKKNSWTTLNLVKRKYTSNTFFLIFSVLRKCMWNALVTSEKLLHIHMCLFTVSFTAWCRLLMFFSEYSQMKKRCWTFLFFYI